MSHWHFSGNSIVTLAGRITKHNQNITAVVANSRDRNTAISLDGIASCSFLQRESGNLNECYCVSSEGMAECSVEMLWMAVVNFGHDGTAKKIKPNRTAFVHIFLYIIQISTISD